MSWKQKLIKEVGKKKAQEILSARGKEMRAQVRNPVTPFSDPEFARQASEKAVAAREAKRFAKYGHKDDAKTE